MTLDLFEKLREHLAVAPDRIAFQRLSEGDRTAMSYREITDEVSRLSRYLLSRGLKPGETVGIVMENHPRWGIAFLAAQSAGARIVPFDILHEAQTLADLIQHAECVFLVSSKELLPKFREIQGLLPQPLPAVISEAEEPGCDCWEQVVQQFEPTDALPLVQRDPDETLLLVYTSGTTGNPKGVMLSNHSLYLTVVEIPRTVELSATDHILSVLPLYHMLALMANFLIPLYLGAQITYLDAIEPQRIVKCFRDEGVTLFVCVPQFYYLIHRRIFAEIEKQSFFKRFVFKRLFALSKLGNRLGWNPGRIFFGAIHKNFGAMRLFAVGGARFDKEVAEDFQNLGFNLAQAYGMTETSAVCTVAHAAIGGLGSVGHPLSYAEVRIDKPADDGTGEVLMRGPHLMQGYWKNPDATAETLKDGWLHSGDLGYLDAKNFLHITGRMKDVIVLSSGKNIFPEEIEQSYEKYCPYIQEMCVVGLEDGSGEEQERLHAVIVPDFDRLKSEGVVNAQDMIRYLLESISQKLPPYKRVRTFEIRRDPLPRTTTRKIKRFEIQQEVESGGGAKPGPRYTEETPAANPVEEKIFQMIRETGKTKVVNREMSLELDCGFDSLERVEFLSNVQDAFRIHISDEAGIEIFTVAELVEAVQGRLSGEIEDEGESSSALSWTEILNAPLEPEDEKQIHNKLRPRPITEVFYYLVNLLLWLLTKIFFRLRIEGKENLPADYPFMICPNHLSFLDGFLVSAAYPFRVLRRLFYLGYADYFGSPVMSYLGGLIKVVPVDSDRYLRQALRLGAHGLRNDLVLCVFPEGERSIDGRLKEFRKGPAILSCELGVPVVPVGIIGSYEAWPRGSSEFKFHPVTIRFGSAIRPRTDETYEEFNGRLYQAVAELLDPAQKG